MEKVFDFVSYGEKRRIVFGKTSYRNNNTLAVLMLEIMPDGSEESYATLTVNLEQSDWLCASGTCAFIDTNNLGENIVDWLVDNGLAKKTGTYGQSGWCSYPLVVFTDEALGFMRAL